MEEIDLLDYGENEVVVYKLNEATLKLLCYQSIAMEISAAFSFEMPGAKFTPLVKMGRWDGIVRIFNLGKRELPSGLFDELCKLCDDRGYTVRVAANPEVNYGTPYDRIDTDESQLKEYVDSLNIHSKGEKLVVDDFQYHAVNEAIINQRRILHAATSAGKSLMIYSTVRYISEELDGKCLILVPTVGLTTQFLSDFKDYSSHNGYDTDANVHLISAGAEKKTKKAITISTYQSLKGVDPDYFNQFMCIITDEGHKITADSFKKIYGAATETPYRLAFTGTLQDLKCNLLQMIGLTGPVVKIITAKELIDRGRATPLKIKALQLNYPEDQCKAMKSVDYDGEIEWLITNPVRNKFIAKIATNTVGTTLVLFEQEVHGKLLVDAINALNPSRPVKMIYGKIKAKEREETRLEANEEDTIIVCSLGTMSTGINLPSVANIIYAHPTKGSIRYIQTIGRGIRLKVGKLFCRFFDIGDNLTYKKKQNHTFKHFGIRMGHLAGEGHDFEVVTVPFN